MTKGFIIVLQRLVVAASCVIFYLLAIGIFMKRAVSIALLATLAVLACIEKLCSVLNMVSVETDWASSYYRTLILTPNAY